MKKSKLFAAALAVTTFAVGCSVFTACKKDDGETGGETPTHVAAVSPDCTHAGNSEYWVKGDKYYSDEACTTEIAQASTVIAALNHDFTGAPYVATDENRHWQVCIRTGCNETSTKENHSYTDGVCGACGRAEGQTENPPETTEYTITLNVGDGTVAAGTALTYTTVDGKLPFEATEYLPEPTIATAHWHFDNWYDAETDGNAIDEHETVFTADTTIYARYVRDNGVWIGETFNHALTLNAGNTTTKEYWLGGGKITLAKDNVISIYMNGKLLSVWVDGSSAGIEKPASSVKASSVTVTVAGEFAIYLKDYSSASNPDNWVCEYAGPTEVNVGSEVPEGCDAIHITIGTNEITFYLTDKDGNGIGADDFSKYCIYTFTPEIFGNWAGATTNGVLAAEMTGTGTAMPAGWIFRWGSNYGSQTANITGLKAGSTYLIQLPAAHNGTATVTELQLAAE